MAGESVLLGLDDAVLDSDDAAAAIAQVIPFPAADANKYSRGRMTLIAGSKRYPGAAALAARAAQRMGAGYTHVVCAPSSVGIVQAMAPSLVVESWEGWGARMLPPDTPEKPAAVCLGPGFDPHDTAAIDLAADALLHAECPVIVDGGAFALLEQPRGRRIMEKRGDAGLATVITPHGGEAAHLARAWDVNGDRDGGDYLAMDLSVAMGAIVLLKGPASHIAIGEDELILDFGGPELAKAGTGDVLAGMVGALLAQRLNAYDAATLAATVHALAGSIAEKRLTSVSVTAEDVIDRIPDALASLDSARTERRA